MPNTIGNDKAAQERTRLTETLRFNLIFVKDNMELLAKLLDQGKRWMDFPPLWLTNAEDQLNKTMKLIDELLKELKS